MSIAVGWTSVVGVILVGGGGGLDVDVRDGAVGRADIVGR